MAAGVLPRDLGERVHLVRRDVAYRQQDVRGAVAGLRLLQRVRPAPHLEALALLRRPAVARRVRAASGRFLEQCEVGLAVLPGVRGGQRRQLRFVESAELVDAEFRDEELDARLVLVAALAEPVPDADHGFDGAQLLAHRNEVDEHVGDAGRSAEAAADADAEALLPALFDGHQADVMDRDQAAVFLAGGVRDLELARQLLVDGVPQEVAQRRLGVRRDVEHAVIGDAGERVGGDVADGVAAGLARRDADLGEAAHHLRRVFEHHEVDLDRLSRRDVAELPRRIPVGDVGDGVELVGRQRAVRHLDAHHLAVGLTLAVRAVLEAERPEVVAEAFAGAPGERVPLEVIDLGFDDRVIRLVNGELRAGLLGHDAPPPVLAGALIP